MVKKDDYEFRWPKIRLQLERQRKAELITLIEELVTVSPDVQRFLHTRYLTKKTSSEQVILYHELIQSHFVVSDWNNSISWNFAGVLQALDEYVINRPDDKHGLVELVLFALEASLAFADQFSLQDFDFDEGVTELAERYMKAVNGYSAAQPKHTQRLKKILQTASELGYYALIETIET